MTTANPVLEMRGISKRFDSTQALDDVALTLYPGEIHALLGENGAGKSTLIKIMTGIHAPDAGEILLDGRPIRVSSPIEAQGYGIAAIHQEPMIFPDLTVAENIFISHRAKSPFVNWGRMVREADEILDRLDVHLDVRSPARGLTLAQQQAVEIAKAISLNVRVLIMDEPTASLSAHEVDQLFKLAHNLRSQGVAILFISHRMEEVFSIADRVTVFRDGQFVSSRPRAEVTQESAIRDMVGRQLGEFFARRQSTIGEKLLSVHNLGKDGAFDGITFDVHAGEVLGFAGLVGARRTDVGLALFGIEPADRGEVILQGQAVSVHSPEQAMRLGIAYVTEDRRNLADAVDVDCHQHHPAHVAPVHVRAGIGGRPRRKRHRRAVPPTLDDPHTVGGAGGREIVGRQPAEGRPQQVAQHAAQAAHPRRADPRHRCGGESRSTPHDRRSGRRRHRHHPDFVGSARSAGHERPHPRHARRAAEGDLRSIRGDTGTDFDGSNGMTR